MSGFLHIYDVFTSKIWFHGVAADSYGEIGVTVLGSHRNLNGATDHILKPEALSGGGNSAIVGEEAGGGSLLGELEL